MSSPRKRLVVHIGTQKTGSTSLQRSLHAGADILMRSGARYASLARSGHAFKHVSTLRAAKSTQRALADGEFEALTAELAATAAHTLILSEERFWKGDLTPLQFFKRFRPACEVVVVVCLRRQDLYVESLYNQAMRTGVHEESRPIPQFWRDPDVAERLDYHRLLTAWQTAVDQVIPIHFNAATQATGVTGPFLQAIQVPVDRPLPTFSANPSPDGNAILALRLLRERAIEHAPDALIAVARALPTDATPLRHFLGQTERQALLASVHASNLALARDFHIEFDEQVPQEAADPVTRPSAAYLARLVGALSLRPGEADNAGPAARPRQPPSSGGNTGALPGKVSRTGPPADRPKI